MTDVNVDAADQGKLQSTLLRSEVVMALIARVISILAGALTVAQPAFADDAGGRYHGPHMWDGGGWMFLGPLWMIVVIAGIIAVIVLLVRWLSGTGHNGSHGRPLDKMPIDILKERFARGEIDKEEFEERRKVLE